jgi:hypothetical protein
MNELSSRKKLLLSRIDSLLADRGFSRNGYYFRRCVGGVRQALYLQPSRHGGEYFPEMLITFCDLNAERVNTQHDAHLRARLSSYYHPLGSPASQQEWSCRLEGLTPDSPLLVTQIPEALESFMRWLDQFPSVEVAADKMRYWSHARSINAAELFADLKQAVPVPIANR